MNRSRVVNINCAGIGWAMDQSLGLSCTTIFLDVYDLSIMRKNSTRVVIASYLGVGRTGYQLTYPVHTVICLGI